MKIKTETISLSTQGFTDMVDLTGRLEKLVKTAKMTEGQMTVFIPGSTGGVTTIEYEPGLQQDLPEMLEKIAPMNAPYLHNETWHDGNGASHLRSALIGPSLTIPFTKARLTLGTWQQVILLDFDNRPRDRTVIVQLIGE